MAGGLTLLSGPLDIPHSDLHVQSLQIGPSADSSQPVIQIKPNLAYFSSHVIDIDLTSLQGDNEDFTILQAKVPRKKTSRSESEQENQLESSTSTSTTSEVVIEILGDGSIRSQGSLWLEGQGDLVVSSGLTSLNQLSLKKSEVKAGAQVTLSWGSSHSRGLGTFVEVQADGISGSLNQLHIECEKEPKNYPCEEQLSSFLEPGQLLLLSNQDDDPLQPVGDWIPFIPPRTTALFIFNGKVFQDIQALQAPVQELRNITSFTAKSDLHVGDEILFSAGRLASTQLQKGRIPIVGSQGVLLDSEKLTFVKGVLQIPSLKVGRLLNSEIDGSGSEIR